MRESGSVMSFDRILFRVCQSTFVLFPQYIARAVSFHFSFRYFFPLCNHARSSVSYLLVVRVR